MLLQTRKLEDGSQIVNAAGAVFESEKGFGYWDEIYFYDNNMHHPMDGVLIKSKGQKPYWTPGVEMVPKKMPVRTERVFIKAVRKRDLVDYSLPQAAGNEETSNLPTATGSRKSRKRRRNGASAAAEGASSFIRGEASCSDEDDSEFVRSAQSSDNAFIDDRADAETSGDDIHAGTSFRQELRQRARKEDDEAIAAYIETMRLGGTPSGGQVRLSEGEEEISADRDDDDFLDDREDDDISISSVSSRQGRYKRPASSSNSSSNSSINSDESESMLENNPPPHISTYHDSSREASSERSGEGASEQQPGPSRVKKRGKKRPVRIESDSTDNADGGEGETDKRRKVRRKKARREQRRRWQPLISEDNCSDMFARLGCRDDEGFEKSSALAKFIDYFVKPKFYGYTFIAHFG